MGNSGSKSKPKSASGGTDEVMAEAAFKAARIRASRGNYEAEVSCTGEVGLHQCLNMCPKNPGHHNFIPTNTFNIEHLPTRYRDADMVDYVRAVSDLTCRLSVPRISGDRPDTWPDSGDSFPFSTYKGENCAMTGTGWVSSVVKYKEETSISCTCADCRRPGRLSKKAVGKIYIHTACHVVYDDEEARDTKCHFLYDSHETDIDNVLSLTGLKVIASNIEGDTSRMVYVTHDIELLDRFDKMCKRMEYLSDKVNNKYWSVKHPRRVCLPSAPDLDLESNTNAGHHLCIVVSHPHGCTKQVSIGTWTRRHVTYRSIWGEEDVTYNYNTPTCPGSSGAHIMVLAGKTTRPGSPYRHPSHSQGRLGNDNDSGRGFEVNDKVKKQNGY